ncbi:hypothetical protein HU200_022534 [Digitaria exilis]|uniref:KIB1-4 beta-propeller domain-containing protein n=1 Tax=Digitaria exilis TaxID=1010633 RepID=A0A835C497_9POAL|nr:hypothetical protein HU200_022534 [Digitaria exilis]
MAWGSTGWASLPADLLLAVFSFLPSDTDRVRSAPSARPGPPPRPPGARAPGLSARAPTAPAVAAPRSRPSGSPPAAAAISCPSPSTCPWGSSTSPRPTGTSRSPTRVLIPRPSSSPTPSPAGSFASRPSDSSREWAAVAVGFPTSCLTHYTSATGAWAQIDYSVPGYTGVEHYNGRFYVAFRSQICVVEANRLVPAVIPLEHVDDAGDGSEDDDKPPGCGANTVEAHLVECGGELLLVSVHDDVVGPLAAVDDDRSASKSGGGTDVARAVEVYRVEWLGDAAVRLVREVDIGWYALFLGRNRAFALSAAKFPACRVNCVYLVDRQGHPDGVVRVLDVRESQWASREETIVCPDDGRRGPSSAGWARRGWFFPSY